MTRQRPQDTYLTLPVVSYFKATGLPIPDPSGDTTTLAAAF
ncbi:hypothetical protein ACVDG5_007295 [Mesorhizobium sp. ORM6]